MIKNIYLIWGLLLLVFICGRVDSYYCDWFTEWTSCESWSTIENIDDFDWFNKSYPDVITWYFWNKNISNFSDELETDLWYMGNKFNDTFSAEKWSTIGFLWNKRNVLSPDYQTPIGMFWLYKNQNLAFTQLKEENNFLWYPLIKYNSNDEVLNIWYWNTSSLCISPKNLTNTKIEIKGNWLLDYVHLTWDNPWKEKIKIIRISPEKKEFIVDNWVNYFDDNDVKIWNNSYFIVVYNDCNPNWLYSDILNINYEWKDNSSKIYLTLSKYELVLYVPSTIKINNSTKINIECKNNSGTFIKSFILNYKYSFDTKTVNKYFTCEASFFDLNGVYKKSELFINNPLKNSYLTEKQALDYIYISESNNQLFNWLYLNISKFDSWSNLTYGKSSLYLINIIWKTYISNEELSFDTLKNLRYFPINTVINDKITEGDFINLLMFIEKDLSKFQKDSYIYINSNYWNKKYNLVLNDIKKLAFFKAKLDYFKQNDSKTYDILSTCLLWESCSNLEILNKLNKEFDKLVFSQEKDIFSYNDYARLLYFELWYNTYKSKNYSLEQYNKFINILLDSITYGDDFYKWKINYSSYISIQFEVQKDQDLMKNVSYLVDKCLEKINIIYDSSKKEDLLGVLRDFLGE